MLWVLLRVAPIFLFSWRFRGNAGSYFPDALANERTDDPGAGRPGRRCRPGLAAAQITHRVAPLATLSPLLKLICLITPSPGATSVFSIFIASRTTTASPLATASPGFFR